MAVLQVFVIEPGSLACVVLAALESVLERRWVVALASAFGALWVGFGRFVSASGRSFEDCVAP